MSTQRRTTIAVISVIALALLVFGGSALHRQYGSGYGMMNFPGTNTFGMMGGYAGYTLSAETKTEAELQADIQSAQEAAQIDEQANTIRYTGSEVHLVIVGGPEEADEKFVIGGLINPTLYLPRDATVTITFVNADAGMPHAFEITSAQPPYPYMTMMTGGVYPNSFISTLPAAAADAYPTAEITFQAGTAGTFYYLCQYPGHAQEGMYGTIVIE